MPEDMRDLAGRLHGGAVRLLRMLRRGEEDDSLSAPRLSALSVIASAGPMSLAGLAAAEQVKPPTMSRIVEALVTQGLITREAKAGDRRSVCIAITAEGRALLDAGRARRMRLLVERLSGLADSERRALARGVELLERIAR